MSKSWQGAYATKWEGWEVAWIHRVTKRKLWKWNLSSVKQLDYDDFKEYVPNVCGVYVFLTRSDYVLYVGRSKTLGTRILRRYNDFHKYKRTYVKKFTAHRALNMEEAKNMELDLIWFYTPPWNTKFFK